MTLQQEFENFCKNMSMPFKKNLSVDGKTPVDSFYYNGDNGCYPGYAMCCEEDKLFIVFASLNIDVKEEMRGRAEKLLNRINYELKAGKICMDEETGALTVRISQYAYGDDSAVSELVSKTILLCGLTADSYYLILMKELVL